MYNVVKGKTTYGVKGKEIFIEDLFADLSETKMFVDMLNKCNVSSTHLFEIIEDYFGSFDF